MGGGGSLLQGCFDRRTLEVEDETLRERTLSSMSISSKLSWQSSDSDEPCCCCREGEDREKRFHLVPPKGWDHYARRMGVSARNNLPWTGQLPVPEAPPCDSWLLPASDELSLIIAELEDNLRKVGWKLITSRPDVIEKLGNKAQFRDYASEIGMLAYLPEHFHDPDQAHYPCVLKPAVGEFGKDTAITNDADDVLNVTEDGFGDAWVLQELIPGCCEYAVSLLVQHGKIRDFVGTEYMYDQDVYVWPNVEEVSRTPYDVPAEHLDVMQRFLKEYHGICNFNYKVRDDGRIGILEVNTRIGSDLACDVPRDRANAFFELLDTLPSERASDEGATP